MKKELITANWPSEKGTYKVVQLYFDKEPLLRFGSRDSFHSEILRTFLELEAKVDYCLEKDIDNVDVPARKGDRYIVPGMGNSMLIKSDRKMIDIYGTSHGYNDMGIDTKHLKKIYDLHPDWRINY